MSVSSSLAALGSSLRHSVFPALPPEHRAGFARSTAYANWLHALCLAVVAVITNAAIGLLPELHYYRSGFWPRDSLHLALTLLHAFMIVTSLVAIASLLRLRPTAKETADPPAQALALAYCCVMLVAVTLFSAVEQRLAGSLSAYLLGVAVLATLFYTTLRFSLFVFAASFLLLFGASWWLHPPWPVLWHQLFVAFDAVVIFWFASRVVFALKLANYLQLVTIEQQARALAATNAELARANQFKSDLLNLAAHDLRDPLNVISLSAQTLRNDLPAASPLQTVVAGIDDSARRLAEFVGNLLTDLASEAHEIHLDPVPTALSEFVGDIVRQLESVAAAKSITLQFSADASALRAPAALVDHACFRQIVENLVTNAIKYSPAHRTVRLELTHSPANGHRLTVRDEGAGLTPEDKTRLFGRYQRLSARPTHGENSIGLGLFIVKSLITLHHGHISAESDGPGRGATFIVTLP